MARKTDDGSSLWWKVDATVTKVAIAVAGAAVTGVLYALGMGTPAAYAATATVGVLFVVW